MLFIVSNNKSFKIQPLANQPSQILGRVIDTAVSEMQAKHMKT
jgi:hypothetical protein